MSRLSSTKVYVCEISRYYYISFHDSNVALARKGWKIGKSQSKRSYY